MNCNELSTLAANQIPVIELIFNNTVLGMVRQWQKLFYENRFSQTDLDHDGLSAAGTGFRCQGAGH